MFLISLLCCCLNVLHLKLSFKVDTQISDQVPTPERHIIPTTGKSVHIQCTPVGMKICYNSKVLLLEMACEFNQGHVLRLFFRRRKHSIKIFLGWLECDIRKVLRPAISTQVSLGFPVYFSKCSDASRYFQVATTCFTCSPPYLNC